MRRREILGLFGCVVVASPLELRAQQTKVPVIEFLSGRSPEDSVYVLAAFRRGLRESGFVDGHNITFDSRWARGHYNELPAMAADLVNRQVDVLVGVAAAQNAAKLSTTTIPIVFVMGGDPVKAGLVKSINRPGGNVTGSVILGITEMMPKKFGLLRELMPGIRNIGAVINPNFYAGSQQLNQLKEAALKVGRQITVAYGGQ